MFIDPLEVPGLRFPAPGGPSASAVLAAVRRLASSGRVRVLDVACPWLEPTDEDQQQARRALLAELSVEARVALRAAQVRAA